MCLKSFFLVLLCFIVCANTAKILGVFHNPSRSHFILGSTLMEALAKKGHQVTIIGPYPVKTTLDNYEVIKAEGLQMSKDEVIRTVRAVINGTMYEKFRTMQDNYKKVTELFLNHPEFKNLINSNRTYDMVVIDWVFNEAFLAIADHFKAHSVVLSGIGSSSTVNKLTINPSPSSYVTNILPAVSDEMSFFQRMANTWARIIFEFMEILQKYTQDRLIRQHFPNAPYVGDLYRNVSLVLINSHFTIETPRPYVPNMVTVGGFHIPEPKPLEKGLKKFLDEATEGVVYCSFGSIIRSADLSVDTINMLAKTFAKLPYKVLWKFESDALPEMPSNVKTAKWFPQSDVLAHPNVKVFVSHGGLLSLLETIYHGVPIVAVPFYGDQEANVELAVSKGYGKRLAFHDLNEVTLTKAIKGVINNPKYKQNAKERSEWYRDQPMKPLDTAVYWIEYVLRHKGAYHMQTAALKLSWYQYYLLDIVAFVTAVLVLAYITLKRMFRLMRNLRRKKPIVSPKKFL